MPHHNRARLIDTAIKEMESKQGKPQTNNHLFFAKKVEKIEENKVSEDVAEKTQQLAELTDTTTEKTIVKETEKKSKFKKSAKS